MSFKVVKNASGQIVAYGPDHPSYAPVVPTGGLLEIVEEMPDLPIVPPSIEEQRRSILDQVGCMNEVHLQKDILLAEGFGAMGGETPGPTGSLYQRNATYRALLTAKAALDAL